MKPALVLIDGEHHPQVVADALVEIEQDHRVVGVVFCGGSEKVGADGLADAKRLYGHDLIAGSTPVAALRAALKNTAAEIVIDLADEPRVNTAQKMQLAALANAHGLTYQAPGLRIDPVQQFDANVAMPVISVIGTGKRTGKTAVCAHFARLLVAAGHSPAIVSLGRGGPAEPTVASPTTGLAQLLAISAEGVHAASDYLEDAVTAGVPTVGCRRVGGGPGGAVWATNLERGVALAATIEDVDCLLIEGSGAVVPPVRADATICVAGTHDQALLLDGPLRLLAADLILSGPDAGDISNEATAFTDALVAPFLMRPVACSPVPADARVAFFTTGRGELHGHQPVFTSRQLADRSKLADDIGQAREMGCTHYLTEIKAAAIDMVATAAQADGAEVIFVRNEIVGAADDLDPILLRLHALAVERSAG
ncbi:MAG: hypothetical protein JHC87_05020 [Thermoleophilaceae bacterium]|nr:hypothetical protein [Thermoleophilaceae bacterium]